MNVRLGRQRCPSNGALRIAVDAPDELDAATASHLWDCMRCQQKVAQYATNAAAADALTSRLARNASIGSDSAAALSTFKTRIQRARPRAGAGGVVMDRLRIGALPRAVAGVAAALIVVAALALSPMRTVADDFLNQFRVQKFEAVTIPMDALAPMAAMMAMSVDEADLEQMKADFDSLGTFESTFQFDEEAMKDALTLDEAQAKYGDFLVPGDLPDGFAGDPQVYVTESGEAAYTMNVQKAHDLIDASGLPIFSLPDPDVYPTVTFTLYAPAAVAMTYTNADDDVLIVGQMESPSLSIPDGVDMDALREDFLRFPGLPSDLVAELRSIDDWENTLIIPIPEGATSRDVTVDGKAGLLIEAPDGSVVLWEDDGVLHGVGGQVSGDEALEVARSLR